MQTKRAKHIVDILLGIGLLLLMSYQVVGEAGHEWTGITMTVLMIIHQILNRKWITALFKGKYMPLRIVQTFINAALVICFILTAVCGINMSVHAVPFLSDFMRSSLGRRLHLTLSHWCFVLMGLHLGLHIPAMLKGIKDQNTRRAGFGLSLLAAGTGLWLFLRNNYPDYLFYRVPFAFIDYDKAVPVVLFEALLIAFFWVFAGAQLPKLLNRRADKNSKLVSLIGLLLAVIIGMGLAFAFPWENEENRNEDVSPWGTVNQEETAEQPAADTPVPADSTETPQTESEEKQVDDGFVWIEGDTFQMGSPETENWRINDEIRHEVALSGFWMSPYEVTQAEYERLMGVNPSSFTGESLPVESVSWMDAVRFCNAMSAEADLTPAYVIDGEAVTWDRGADGYRLPTEAEWEYACRAGTTTPFNTVHSTGPEEANYYGHYPYEIEENYFDDSVLETRPGRYRQTTVDVTSFAPNPWGLYNMHGNVNEWCWDLYGAYDLENTVDPTGSETGTRRVYRGGGWNDFGKNLRSAYRAAGELNMASYNLGIRLVRSAGKTLSGTVSTSCAAERTQTSGKMLIAYFSWSGNTQGVAQEIQRQTGADIFEIMPIPAYSDDYNTVLMEAQRDQHDQARPAIANLPQSIDEYDVILLGYPNWWASIPMPIATFLESYDFTGKTILPFCSHGGGRFGQSLTAIAKLAPQVIIAPGLSVHYSGGSSLTGDVRNWLESQGIQTIQ
ncbi:MAG: SUMF1/EgtB/PvdO family nonheme iron enzyme [Clostridia bacterium]|nr:SUMF1/EgtB/PvdO family nonheme iron enzyme [Clostridia bacterium]